MVDWLEVHSRLPMRQQPVMRRSDNGYYQLLLPLLMVASSDLVKLVDHNVAQSGTIGLASPLP